MVGSPLKPEDIFLLEEGREKEESGSAAGPADRRRVRAGDGKDTQGWN